MSRPVDVLAVMDSLNLGDPSQRPDLKRARAAVAELAAKADAAMTAMRVVAIAVEHGHGDENELWTPAKCVEFLRAHADNIDDVVARVGGAA